MYQPVIDQFAQTAESKAQAMRTNPVGFMIASMMAGAYVGIGIILIFTLGQLVDPAMRPLVMGTCFGIALTLVVFAGAELFTGHTMIMSLGVLSGTASSTDLIKSWIMTWIGNLLGSVLVAYLFYFGGGGAILKSGNDFIFTAAAGKMAAPVVALVARGILCNWLVCLALWMAQRTKDDTAKAIVIFWCLFAFIAAGFEHSVANMTIFSIALLGNHPDSVSISGAAYNLAFVTIGNIIAGVFFMACAYFVAAGRSTDALRSFPIASLSSLNNDLPGGQADR